MESLYNLVKYGVVLFLAVFYATTLMAGELPGFLGNSSAQESQTGMDTSLNILGGNTSGYFTGYPAGLSGTPVDPFVRSKPDVFSPDYLTSLFQDHRFTFTLFKDSNGNKWSLASLGEGFSLNPITDIRNMGVILQLKF